MTTNAISKTPITERDTWRTPQWLFDYASKIVGGIDFDTACDSKNALAVPVWNIYTTKNALDVEWINNCWCNPPYSNIEPWIDKATSSKRAITVMLIPSPNGESYYSKLIANSHEIAIQGRVSFIDANGLARGGNTRGSSLFIINGYTKGTRSTINRDEIKNIHVNN